MGEKIRDISTVTLCNSKLMVELNEGYNSAQGRVIHIQNNYFRYLLKIKDFYKLSADILRAEAEFGFIKQKQYTLEPGKEINPFIRANFKYFELLGLLRAKSVDFRILKGLDSIVTILVNPRDASKFMEIIRSSGAKKYFHPFSKWNGYSFLYQMTPFQIYRYKCLFYEVFFQLPCLSLTEKTWMPLDKSVQAYIWNNPPVVQFDSPFVDEIIRCIYRLTECVFRKRCFHYYDIAYFKQHTDLLRDDRMNALLDKIFFKNKSTIVDLVCAGRYEKVIQEYFTRSEY